MAPQIICIVECNETQAMFRGGELAITGSETRLEHTLLMPWGNCPTATTSQSQSTKSLFLLQFHSICQPRILGILENSLAASSTHR
ncbi:hypothetical protein Pelo_10594 [Pelomyxa schiedti]|nr:hypothetical protein Pelo_10594 [Pelomyxa schiedti]